MTIDEIIQLLIENGVLVGVVAYFMYQNTQLIQRVTTVVEEVATYLKVLTLGDNGGSDE